MTIYCEGGEVVDVKIINQARKVFYAQNPLTILLLNLMVPCMNQVVFKVVKNIVGGPLWWWTYYRKWINGNIQKPTNNNHVNYLRKRLNQNPWMLKTC